MAATAAQIATLRRMIAEADSTIYSDDDLAEYIEAYPLIDERGAEPYTWDTSTSPPTQDANDSWVATYDLHAAAAVLWEEKAATLAADFDFSADGSTFDRSQAHQHALNMAQFHARRRSARTITQRPEPEKASLMAGSWIANLAEQED